VSDATLRSVIRAASSQRAVLTVLAVTAMIRMAPVGSKGASQTDSPGSLFLVPPGKGTLQTAALGHQDSVAGRVRRSTSSRG